MSEDYEALRAEWHSFRKEVRETLDEIRNDLRTIRETEIARAAVEAVTAPALEGLPERVRALEESRGGKHWTLSLAESEHGRTVIRWICVAVVASALALAGGLSARDLGAWLGQAWAAEKPSTTPTKQRR